MSDVEVASYAEDFSASMQRKILALLIREQGLYRRMSELVHPGYFESDIHQTIARHAFEFTDKYDELPTKTTLQSLASKTRRGEVVTAEIGRLFKLKLKNVEFVEEQIIAFAKKQALKGAILSAVSDLRANDDPDFGDIQKNFEKALQVGELNFMETYLYFQSTKSRLKSMRKKDNEFERWPTGFKGIDKATMGGIPPKKLCVILGAVNSGKSAILVNLGMQALARGRHVHYVTLEMSLEETAQRFDQCISNKTYRQLVTSPIKESFRRITRFSRKHGGFLSISEYSPRRLSINGLRADLVKANEERPVDVLIIDYADIMSVPGGGDGDDWKSQGAIYEQLHGFAKQQAIRIWTGCQTTRQGLNRPIVRLDQIGESWRKAAISDLVIAICQTETEEQQNAMRFFTAKNRIGPSKRIISHLETRWSTMRVKEVNHARPTPEDDDEEGLVE